MTKRQKQLRTLLRKKNKARVKKKQYTRVVPILGGVIHKTSREYLSDDTADFTLCGLQWDVTLRSSVFIDAYVNCFECVKLIRKVV